MTKTNALSRPAMSAIAAFLALSTPAAFAQDAPTVTMTPPVAPITVPAPAPTTEIPATQPVIRVPLDIAPAEPAPKAEQPKAAAAPTAPKPAAAKPRPAEPASTTPRATVATDARTPAPVIEEAAPIAAPVPAPVEPVAEAMPVPAERATAGEDASLWEIAGGAAALLLAGGIGLAFLRRRRAAKEVWDFDEVSPDAEWIPGAAAAVAPREPEPQMTPQSSPVYAPAPGNIGRHEALAMAGPTADNPFATLHKRLARARFLDQKERANYEATLASQKDMRRKPVSAWEISQRPAAAAAAEQEVRRPEAGRPGEARRPGLARG